MRYLAVHTIVVNLDSYSSSMAQNYYLYENDGKVTVLPWDYNLAWGGFQSGSASSVINFPIDTPVSGVEMTSRPLIEKLLSNTEYMEKYHNYLQQLMDSYFMNGAFEAKITALDMLISQYVENDPSKLCTYQEYQTAVPALIKLGNLRAESISGQLDGSIPSTTSAQKSDSTSLVSDDGLNLSDLGSMMGGGRGERNNEQFTNKPTTDAENNATPPPNHMTVNTVDTQKYWLLIGGLFILMVIASIVVRRFRRSY